MRLDQRKVEGGNGGWLVWLYLVSVLGRGEICSLRDVGIKII